MIYLDSCVVIPLTEAEDTIRLELRQNIAAYVTQGIAVSELTRLECRVYPLAHHLDFLLEQYDGFFASPEIKKIDFSLSAWELATRIRAKYALQVPDALHLAVASEANCQVFCTCDKKLARIAKKFMEPLVPMSLQGVNYV